MKGESEHKVIFIGDLETGITDDNLLVSSDLDYLESCRMLASSLANRTQFLVYVRNRSHFTWLKEFSILIKSQIIFDEMTALELLKEKWGVDIPHWLEEKDVIENGILDLIDGSSKFANFEDIILAIHLDECLATESFKDENLVNIIHVLINQESISKLEDTEILYRCLSEKLNSWSDSSNAAWVKEICSLLLSDADKVWQLVTHWSLLHTYPKELLVYVVPQESISFIQEIPTEVLKTLKLEPNAEKQALGQMESFLETIVLQVDSSEDLIKIVELTSGRYRVEFDYIQKTLFRNKLPLTSNDVQLIRNKFSKCPGISSVDLNAIKGFVKPERPKVMSEGERWEAEEWIEWAVNYYIPYRRWQIVNNSLDNKLEETVKEFSKFYLEEYFGLQNDYRLSLAQSLTSIDPERIKNEVSIVILLDCLPLEYFEQLDRALQEINLSRENTEYKFAQLPTSTEFNKPSLVSGDINVSGYGYEKLLTLRSERDWGSVSTQYYHSLLGIAEAEVSEAPTVILLNLTDSDEILHSDVESGFSSYDEEMSRLFVKLGQALDRLLSNLKKKGLRSTFYVLTDHGACRILEGESSSFDSKIVKRIFPEEKHRYGKILHGEEKLIPDSLWELGYKFNDERKNDEYTYFLPKGHNTVSLTKSSSGYVHGGISPEEVIVPFAVYNTQETPFKQPNSRFLDIKLSKDSKTATIYVQRITSFNIEIQNPNDHEIQILRAKVRPEAVIKNFTAKEISGKSSERILLECYFHSDAKNHTEFNLEVNYEYRGEEHSLYLDLKTEFKSAVRSGFNLKDL